MRPSAISFSPIRMVLTGGAVFPRPLSPGPPGGAAGSRGTGSSGGATGAWGATADGSARLVERADRKSPSEESDMAIPVVSCRPLERGISALQVESILYDFASKNQVVHIDFWFMCQLCGVFSGRLTAHTVNGQHGWDSVHRCRLWHNGNLACMALSCHVAACAQY